MDATQGKVLNDNLVSHKEKTATMVLIFENKEVEAIDWESDETYENYGFKVDIPCDGVTVNHKADVVFDVEDATSGIFAPVCITDEDTVTIFASEEVDVTIPTIVCMKAVV